MLNKAPMHVELQRGLRMITYLILEVHSAAMLGSDPVALLGVGQALKVRQTVDGAVDLRAKRAHHD